MILKKISWIFKRHPFLYKVRFKLLSKNSSESAIKDSYYNLNNHKSAIPRYFYIINDLIFETGKPSKDLDTVKQLSIWLRNNIKGGPGLSEPSEEALKIMISGKGGVCSDMAQIFNNFCVINDIKVREWGATRAPFNKKYGGHSFNEVFITDLNKWVLIDTSYCVLFYDVNEMPLSLIEFFKKLRSFEHMSYKFFNKPKSNYKDSVEKNYFSPDTVPFLICNYSNKTYDWFLKIFRPFIPIFMIHFFIFLIGKSYGYKFPLDDHENIFLK